MEREVMISSHWDPVIGQMGMVQSYSRGGLDWTLGSKLLPSGQTLEQASKRDGQCPKPVSVL